MKINWKKEGRLRWQRWRQRLGRAPLGYRLVLSYDENDDPTEGELFEGDKRVGVIHAKPSVLEALHSLVVEREGAVGVLAGIVEAEKRKTLDAPVWHALAQTRAKELRLDRPELSLSAIAAQVHTFLKNRMGPDCPQPSTVRVFLQRLKKKL